MPAILVESPVAGDVVTSPIHVRGTANVFEAVFNIDVIDGGGRTVARQRVMATSGTGTRGTFEAVVAYASSVTGEGALVAWVTSPKDGSRIDVATTPLVVNRS